MLAGWLHACRWFFAMERGVKLSPIRLWSVTLVVPCSELQLVAAVAYLAQRMRAVGTSDIRAVASMSGVHSCDLPGTLEALLVLSDETDSTLLAAQPDDARTCWLLRQLLGWALRSTLSEASSAALSAWSRVSGQGTGGPSGNSAMSMLGSLTRLDYVAAVHWGWEGEGVTLTCSVPDEVPVYERAELQAQLDTSYLTYGKCSG
jgi:hypothetical protein